MATRLYVGNLSYNLKEEDLRAAFQEAGAVSAVNIIRDRMTGQSRGFGFVEMDSAEDAQKAIAHLNGRQLDSREIVVNEARPQAARGDRGGGRGSRPQSGNRY